MATGVVAESRPKRALFLGALIVSSVVFLYPFWWLVSASLKQRDRVFDNAILPNPVVWDNYVTIWSEVPLWRWFGNTLLISVAAATAVTISSAMVAFAFAYFRFRGRGVLFGLVLATMLLPGVVTLVPTYLIWDRLGFAGTQVPLWAGNLFASAFYIFLLRQFFLTLPRELYEAGRLDGLNPWGLFRRIVVPLSMPALIIAFIFELRASWTDLLKPLVFLRDPQYYTLPLGLKTVLDQFGKGGELQWEVVLAASVLSTIPMILLFLALQRYFVEGIATTGRKG